MNFKSIVRVFVTTVVLVCLSAALSCGGNPTSPSTCTAGPYTFDTGVQRCRASNGQFADNACCGR